MANVFEKPSSRIVRSSRPVRRDRVVLAVVDHLRVHLVRQHVAVVVVQEPRDLDVHLARHDAAGRVGGRVQDHELRARREALGEIVGGEREAGLLGDRQRHRRGARPADHRLVDREAGVRVDDLVARVAGREHAEEQERLRARRRPARGRGRSRAGACATGTRPPPRAAPGSRAPGSSGSAPSRSAFATPPRRCAAACRSRARRSGGGSCRWPCASSALARASTSNAVSVPRRERLSAIVIGSPFRGTRCRGRAAGARGSVAIRARSAGTSASSPSAPAITAPTSRKSSASRPRMVAAGVPIRMPLVIIGGRGSNGTALRLTVMAQAASRSSACWPSNAESFRFSSSRWLSVPPETSAWPRRVSVSASAAAFATTCVWYRLERLAAGGLEAHGLGGDGVHQRPALHAGEDGGVDLLGEAGAAQDEARRAGRRASCGWST